MGSNPSNGARVASRSHSPNFDTSNGSLRIAHMSVSIFSLLDNSKIVAKGRIVSVDPTSHVRGQALREGWCEVEIFVALHHEERLICPLIIFKLLGVLLD
ncbi:hypothetical protein M9H77_02382 [Catharanthus roseus]|uniref:Uncharacterized protein n=1 Tax=Catharanthus roseus TaxID=4058 RepID=A0ACC0C871_CATRO|nr:hypothetical protein M9H77_02382 [Catharanthus roseus]